MKKEMKSPEIVGNRQVAGGSAPDAISIPSLALHITAKIRCIHLALLMRDELDILSKRCAHIYVCMCVHMHTYFNTHSCKNPYFYKTLCTHVTEIKAC